MKLNKAAEQTIEQIKKAGATQEQIDRMITLATAHNALTGRRVIKCSDIVRAEFIVLGKWSPKEPTAIEAEAIFAAAKGATV